MLFLMIPGMPAGAQIINTAGGKQVYTIVTSGSAIRSMSCLLNDDVTRFVFVKAYCFVDLKTTIDSQHTIGFRLHYI